MKEILSRDKISSFPPQKLAKEPLFWLNTQKDFICVLSFAILILIVFFRYTYSQDSALSNIFNLSIHSLGIWGIILTAKAVATVEINRAIYQKVKIHRKN